MTSGDLEELVGAALAQQQKSNPPGGEYRLTGGRRIGYPIGFGYYSEGLTETGSHWVATTNAYVGFNVWLVNYNPQGWQLSGGFEFLFKKTYTCPMPTKNSGMAAVVNAENTYPPPYYCHCDTGYELRKETEASYSCQPVNWIDRWHEPKQCGVGNPRAGNPIYPMFGNKRQSEELGLWLAVLSR